MYCSYLEAKRAKLVAILKQRIQAAKLKLLEGGEIPKPKAEEEEEEEEEEAAAAPRRKGLLGGLLGGKFQYYSYQFYN